MFFHLFHRNYLVNRYLSLVTTQTAGIGVLIHPQIPGNQKWLENPFKMKAGWWFGTFFTFHNIWVNYNDLTTTSLESWLVRGIIPKWPYFRLVKYYNLPRSFPLTNTMIFEDGHIAPPTRRS